MPCQTVGTPAANVTCSDSISDCSVSGSPIFGPGNTSFAPTIAQPYGSAQALTWNIGTTGRTTSAPASPIASGSADA